MLKKETGQLITCEMILTLLMRIPLWQNVGWKSSISFEIWSVVIPNKSINEIFPALASLAEKGSYSSAPSNWVISMLQPCLQ